MNRLDVLKENAKVFFDQNMGSAVVYELRKRGWKNVSGVFDVGYKGANDGKLLKILKEWKMILITHDKKFAKMQNKYNNEMSLLLEVPKTYTSPRTVALRVEQALLLKFKDRKELTEAAE